MSRIKLIKLKILIGCAQSGKTTLLKQMRLIYSDGFPLEEKMEHGRVMLSNVLAAFQKAVEEMKWRSIEYERETSTVRPGLK